MIDDFTSCSSRSRTAGTSCQPGRAATLRAENFLPHHEPKMMSGARRYLILLTGSQIVSMAAAFALTLILARQLGPHGDLRL